MKRCLATMMIVISLLILTGCGDGKMIASGDDTSLYPYSWRENADGTLTVEISGKWEQNCTWQPTYNEEIFAVTPEKKAGRFTVSGLCGGSSDVDFYLCCGEQETAEYCITLSVSGTSGGELRVTGCTHEEVAAEGDYAYTNAVDGSLQFTIYTDHEWEYRLLEGNFRMYLSEATDESQTYQISAQEEGFALAELWDTQADRKLTLNIHSLGDGYVYVSAVEESEDIALSENALDAFWQALGAELPIPADVTVNDCKIVRDDSGIDAAYGCLNVTVGGSSYDYLMSGSEELAALYTMEPIVDEHDTVIEAQSSAVTLSGGIPAMVYNCDSEVSVIWQADGNTFVLYGEDVSTTAAVSAAGKIAGGING